MIEQDILKPVEGIDALMRELDNTSRMGAVQPAAPLQLPVQEKNAANKQLSDDMFNSIMETASRKAKSAADPYASKFQDASLTDRYEGRNVFYGDTQLDSKTLDARYSKTQSYWEQSANSFKVGLANGGAMFASGMIGLPDMLYNIVNGKGITESKAEKALFDWSKSVSDNNITFENEYDQRTDAWSTIKNVLIPTFLGGGSSKGWGSFFENVSYGIGAGLSLAAQEVAVSFVAPGVGNSAVLALNAAKILNNLNNLRKYGTIADRIIDTSLGLYNASKGMRLGNKIYDAAKWGYRGTIGAYGEAAFEGLEGREAYVKEAKQKFLQDKGYDATGEDLKNIEGLGDEVKKARFWTNMALLMGSNTYQAKRMFRSFDLARESSESLARQGLKTEVNELGEVVAKKSFELKSDWWNKGVGAKLKPVAEKVGGQLNKDLVKESLSEGLEEYSQMWIDKSVNSYYKWKLDHRGQPALNQAIRSISQGFSDSWNTEGLKNFLSGAIAGVGQQAAYGVVGTAYTAATDPSKLNIGKQREDALNETLADYKNFNANDFVKASNVNSVRGTVTDKAQNLNAEGIIDEVADLAADKNDKKIYKDVESLSFFNKAAPYVSKGHADILKQQFEFSVENMSDEQVQQMYDNPNITKQKAVNDFNKEVDSVNESFSRIKAAFRNPYNGNGDVIESTKYKLFEDAYIPELAYLDHRGKTLVKRKADIQSTLGDYYEEFKYFSDEKTIGTGRKYIEDQIKEIKDTAPFRKALADIDAGFQEEYVKEVDVARAYTSALKKLDEYENDKTVEKYNDFLDEYYNAFAIKLEDVNVSGTAFVNKDEVMSKLTDFTRINSDLDSVERMLRNYVSRDGEAMFMESYSTYAKAEQRKRDTFTLSDTFKELRDTVRTEYPELGQDQIDDVLNNSKSEKEVRDQLDSLVKKVIEKNAKTEDFKTKIREKFISSGKGDIVEDYINNITDFNNDVLKQAEDYIKYLNNQDFIDFRDSKKDQFIKDIQKISSNFTEDNIQDVYKTLSNDGKIKYHQEVIKYRKEINSYGDNTLENKKSKVNDIISKMSDDNIYLTHITRDSDAKNIYEGQFKYNPGGGLTGTMGANVSKSSINLLLNDLLDGKSPHRGHLGLFILAIPKSELSGISKLNGDKIEEYLQTTYPEMSEGKIPVKYNYGYFANGQLSIKGVSNIKTQLPEAYKKINTDIILESENEIKELQKEKPLFTQTIGEYLIAQDGVDFNVFKNGKLISTHPNEVIAREAIQNAIDEELRRNDATLDGINNLENKFENGYFNPEWFDTNGNTRQDEDFRDKQEIDRVNKAYLYNTVFDGLSEEQISDLISENLTIDKYSTTEQDGVTLIQKGGKLSGQLVQEPILRSVTNNAVVISYNSEIGKVPLNTYKDNLDLEFVNNSSEVLSKDHYDKNGKLFAKKFEKVQDITLVNNAIMGKRNYKEFLKASLVDSTAYKMLQANGFIAFKGTPQDQLNLLAEKNKVFEYLNTHGVEEIKNNITFTREFVGIRTENAVNTPINELLYPFAKLDEAGVKYNKYTFFRLTETLPANKITEDNIELVGVESEFEQEAKKRILESFNKRFGEKEVYSGYNILIGDSAGNHSTQRLVNKRLTAQQWWENSGGVNFNNVTVLSNDGFTTIAFSSTTSGSLVSVKNGENTTSFPYNINGVKDVEGLIPAILSHINSERKDIKVKSLGLSLALNTLNKPSTREEIIATRDVTGVSSNNFLVSKIVASFKESPVQVEEKLTVTEVPQIIPVNQVVPTPSGGSKQIAEQLGVNIPTTISYDQIDEIVNKSGNLQLATAILLTIKVMDNGGKIYLNDQMRIAAIEPILSLAPSVMESTIRQYKDFANILTTSTPKTNLQNDSVDERVQQLIKNCFK